MELLVVFVIVIALVVALEIRNKYIELKEENEVLRERVLYDIERETKRMEKRMAELDEFIMEDKYNG